MLQNSIPKAKAKTRIKSTGEVFTPPDLVDEIVNNIYDINVELFTKKEKIFLDPACGDGEFLRGIIRKLKLTLNDKFTKSRWNYIIQYQLLGVDLMWDNTCDTAYYLLRSWNLKQHNSTNKLLAYNIIRQYRGKESRSTVLQRIMNITKCSYKAAIPLYSWSTYSDKWILLNIKSTNSTNMIVDTTFKKNHNITDHSAPSDINKAFVQRTYIDQWGTIIIRPTYHRTHYIEYSYDNITWIPIENIIRANSLTEWDFKNWKPIFDYKQECLEF